MQLIGKFGWSPMAGRGRLSEPGDAIQTQTSATGTTEDAEFLFANAYKQNKCTVFGGRPLRGNINVQGSKAAAVVLCAAALSADTIVKLENLPNIADVRVFRALASRLGFTATWEESSSLVVAADDDRNYTEIPPELGGRLRVTPTVAAAVLARSGAVTFPVPGGDGFCTRPIDRHLAAMEAAGAILTTTGSNLFQAVLPHRKPRPFSFSAMTRWGPSVGATATALILAARAEGTSIIFEASDEPEIGDLLRLLASGGIDVYRRRDGAVIVNGSGVFSDAYCRLPADRIEAGTFGIAAALTGGEIRIDGFREGDLPEAFYTFLRASGTSAMKSGDAATTFTKVEEAGNAMEIVTGGRDGFPTDLQPLATVLMSQLVGASRLIERIYPSRYSHLDGLRLFGQRIDDSQRYPYILGPTPLRAATVVGDDIRCVTAYLLAAVAADGESTVSGLDHVARGHDNFLGKLSRLGACIRPRGEAR